jgi:MFS family permease
MTATTAEPVSGQRGFLSSLIHRQLDSYPENNARILYLAITVLATITLYYELYVGGSVSVQILQSFNMSFTFYVVVLAFGNLIGAFGSLFAGLTDRFGRANLVVFGLLFTGIFVTWILPAAPNKWAFSIEGFVVGVVEGICLVATPALIRDFSPQVGRATAMGFWTSGPVLGSLIVAVLGSATLPAVIVHPSIWTHEYHICGYAGLVVFVIALFLLRELSPGLRDQLMVTMRDRALIEARAKGIDIEAALKHPWRQLLKFDIIISAFAVAIMLLIYYTAVGFGVIYLETVFGETAKNANGLGNWNWGFNAIGVIVIGMVSDRFRVRKPFMVIGGVLAAVMIVLYLNEAGKHPSYYTLAIMLALMALGLGIAYTPWMASFTETVEHRNPALIATGLAIWGWIIRVVVFASFLLIPAVINTVTPLVNYAGTVGTDLATYPSLAWAGTPAGKTAIADYTQYKAQFTFAAANPSIVSTATQYATQAANATKYAPELAVIQAHAALFEQAAKYPANKVPLKLQGELLAAAGGGSKGAAILGTIATNEAAIQGVIAAAPQLQQIAPYAAQLQALAKVPASVDAVVKAATPDLQALAKVPPSVTAYVTKHGPQVGTALATTPGQWKTWYWICFGGVIFFLLSIPLLRGRWRPRDAKRDEAEHEAMLQAELAKLGTTS